MKPVPYNNRRARAYSFWSIVISLILFLLPEFWYAYTGNDLANPYAVGWAAVFFGVFGAVGFWIDQAQPNFARTLKLTVIAATLTYVVFFLLALPAQAMTIDPTKGTTVPTATQQGVAPEVVLYKHTEPYLTPLVSRWEGKHPCKDNRALHCSYFDTIAKPPLWTVGYGHTKTAAKGQRLTEGQAMALLGRDLKVYWSGMRKAMHPNTVKKYLTPQRDAAFASLAYNVGIRGVQKSSAMRALNAGDIVDACRRLTFWNKAGNRVVKGLVNRRSYEQKMCLLPKGTVGLPGIA